MSIALHKVARRVLPLVQSRELVHLLLVPLGASFEVVLEPQSTADCTSAWEMLGDVLPLHAVASQLRD